VGILQWNEVIAKQVFELSQFIIHESGFFKDGKSIYQRRESDAAYTGLSGADDWDRETRRWLREGRPVLRKVVEKVDWCTYKVKKNPSREDIKELGLECKVVFMAEMEHGIVPHAVEKVLQMLSDHLDLGHRLHRVAGTGSNYMYRKCVYVLFY